jgi:hypothetical protein
MNKKSYKNLDEFYSAIRALIIKLRQNGNEHEASLFDSLINSAWTTGPELIGELMLSLEKMGQSYPSEIQELKNDCYYFAKHHRQILGLD